MQAAAVAFAAALFSALFVTRSVRDFAVRRNLVDAGGLRKIHRNAVPRLGGVAFVAIWFVVFLAAVAFDGELRLSLLAAGRRWLVFLAGGAAIAALGLVDDVRGLRARHKLLVQFAVAGALCWAGFAVREVQLPTGAVVHLGALGVPLTMLWIAGAMNAMNLIDGLDGLAGGIAGLGLAAVFAMAVALGNPVVAVSSAALLGAVGGFLCYNFNPASIFMGDAGSLFLGYFLAVALLVCGQAPGAAAPELFVPLAVLAVPVADTALAIVRRAARGRGVFTPDRNHLHHRLLAKGFSQPRAVLALYLACAGCCAAALLSWFGGVRVDLLSCSALALASAGLLWKLRLPQDLDLRVIGAQRSSCRRMHAQVAAIATRVDRAASLAEVLAELQELVPAVSAARIRSRIGAFSARTGRLARSVPMVSMRFPLPQHTGYVEVAWADGRAEVDEDHALAIESLCEAIARAARRLEPEAAAPNATTRIRPAAGA